MSNKLARTSSHWNKNVACAIRIKTTGEKIRFHEVFQLSVVALLSDYSIDNTVRPLDILIKPLNPETINWKMKPKSREKLGQAIDYGINPEDVPDHFEDWFLNHLKPGYNTKGFNLNKIIPIGHNFAEDVPFIKDTLTHPCYIDWFDEHHKDAQILANVINDVYAQHGEKVPYSKTSLSFLANRFELFQHKRGDALQECVILSKCYSIMVKNLTRAFRF